MDLEIKEPYWLKRLREVEEIYHPQPVAAHQPSAELWAIYIRVSLEEQTKGYSLDEQERECRLYAQHRGWQVVEVYADEGFSGTTANRPNFQRLLRDGRKGVFRGVLTHRIDRTFRNAQEMLSTFNDWKKQGVGFVSATEAIDFTTPWGKFILAVLAMLAEIFIDNLREETRKGKRGRFHRGLHNGPIPYGYCDGRCSNCTDLNGPGYCYRVGWPDLNHGRHVVPHPIDSQAVQHAYQLYLQGDTTDRQVAEALNQFQVETPVGRRVQVRSRGKPGQLPGPFTKEMVRNMLQNIFYIGEVPYYGSVYNGQRVVKFTRVQKHLQGQHSPLISEAQLDQALKLRDLRNKAPQGQGRVRRPARVYLLQGLLDCSRCGAPMHSQSGSGNARRHSCWSRVRGTGSCTQPSVKADVLEGELFTQLDQLRLPAVWQEEIIGYVLEDEGLEVILAQRKLLQEHFDIIQALYRKQEISRQIYRAEWLAYERGMAALSLDRRADVDLDWARRLLADFPTLWSLLTDLERKEMVRALLDVAVVEEQHVVEWRWYGPFADLFDLHSVPVENKGLPCPNENLL